MERNLSWGSIKRVFASSDSLKFHSKSNQKFSTFEITNFEIKCLGYDKSEIGLVGKLVTKAIFLAYQILQLGPNKNLQQPSQIVPNRTKLAGTIQIELRQVFMVRYKNYLKIRKPGVLPLKINSLAGRIGIWRGTKIKLP